MYKYTENTHLEVFLVIDTLNFELSHSKDRIVTYKSVYNVEDF